MKLIKPIKVNEYVDTKADKIIMRVFVIGLISILLILSFLILYSNNVSAAGVQVSPLPYYESYIPLDNPFCYQNIDFIKNGVTGTDNILVVYKSDSTWNSPFIVCNFPNLSTFYAFNASGSPITIGTFQDFKSDYLGQTSNSYFEWATFEFRNNQLYRASGSTNGRRSTLFGNHNKESWGNGEFTFCYPIYFDQDYYIGDTLVLAKGEPGPVHNPGTATNPGTPSQSSNKPQAPTNTSYTWTTPSTPTIDDSTIITLVKSFINIFVSYVVWLANNLEGFFSNLFSNLWAWLQYLANLLNYWFDEIWSIIKDFMLNFFNNMESLFEPLGENIVKIVTKLFVIFDFLNPDEDDDLPTLVSDIVSAITNFSLSDIQDYLEDFYDDYLSSWFNSWTRVISFFVGLYGLGLNNNNEFSIATFLSRLIIPDHADFVEMLLEHDEFEMISTTAHVVDEMSGFYVSLSNYSQYSVKSLTVPSCTVFGVTIPATVIDFSWFDNYKTYTDTIISAFLIVGYFYWLFTRLSGILNHTSPNISERS